MASSRRPRPGTSGTTALRQPPPPPVTARSPRPERAQAGLFGSTVGGNQVRTATAELLGTFLLVLAGTSVATTSVTNASFYTAGFVGLAFGLALTALAAGLGHVSGCHVNPAVTLGLAVTRQFPWRYVPAYLGAQFAGGILASLVVWGGYGSRARTGPAHLGAAAPGPAVGVWQATLIEAVIAFLLVFVVCSVATDERVPKAAAPVAAGFALAAAVYIGVPVTGGAVNPARAFGPFIVSGTFPMWPVYLLAPVAGGIVGALSYDRFVRRAAQPNT